MNEYTNFKEPFIKSSKNCARCDWPVRVNYSTIKHTAHVTRVLYGVIMHAAYVTSLARAISLTFYKRNKELLVVHC